MDITSDFSASLKQHGASVKPYKYNISRINTFLQEAHNINDRIAELTRTLRSTRARYLSTVPQSRRPVSRNDGAQPLTDREREAFDARSKQILQQLNSAISTLKEAENVRNQTAENLALAKRAKSGLGAVGRWAAGGAVTAKSVDEEVEEARRKTVAAFREAVLLYLQTRLQDASKVQTEMMEVRLGRELEKSKSVLYKSRAAMSIPYAQDEPKSSAAVDETAGTASTRADTPFELSQEQMQLFAAENTEMLKHYEDQLDQVRKAEKSILEISDLHTQLHANLEQQSANIEQLVQDSYLTTENLGKGNKELKKASERRSTARAVFWSTIGFCSFLVVWDLIF